MTRRTACCVPLFLSGGARGAWQNVVCKMGRYVRCVAGLCMTCPFAKDGFRQDPTCAKSQHSSKAPLRELKQRKCHVVGLPHVGCGLDASFLRVPERSHRRTPTGSGLRCSIIVRSLSAGVYCLEILGSVCRSGLCRLSPLLPIEGRQQVKSISHESHTWEIRGRQQVRSVSRETGVAGSPKSTKSSRAPLWMNVADALQTSASVLDFPPACFGGVIGRFYPIC